MHAATAGTSNAGLVEQRPRMSATYAGGARPQQPRDAGPGEWPHGWQFLRDADSKLFLFAASISRLVTPGYRQCRATHHSLGRVIHSREPLIRMGHDGAIWGRDHGCRAPPAIASGPHTRSYAAEDRKSSRFWARRSAGVGTARWPLLLEGSWWLVTIY